MAMKFSDGFDQYAADGVTGPTIQQYLEANGYTVTNSTAATFAIVAGRRAGAHALQFTVARNSSTNASLQWGFTPTGGIAVFGFAMYATGSRMRIARIANVFDLDWDTTTGKMKVTLGGVDQLGVNPLILSAWYYIEIRIDIVAKTAQVFANNELQLTVNLGSVALPTLYAIVWGQVGTAPDAGVQWLDDFYALDASGAVNVDRLGPIEVTTRLPNADVGPNEWTVVGATGTPSHASIVAQLEPNKANAPYLQSNVAGAQDIFRSNGTLPTTNKIFAVSVLAFARKGDLDDRKLGLLVKPEGGTGTEIQLSLTESFKYYQATFEKAPGDTEWSNNIVESLQFGVVTR